MTIIDALINSVKIIEMLVIFRLFAAIAIIGANVRKLHILP